MRLGEAPVEGSDMVEQSSAGSAPLTSGAAEGRTRDLRRWRFWAAWMLGLGGVLAVLAVFSPEFFRVRNLLNVARQGSIVGVTSIGMTVVILTAGIDLSVGSLLALSAVTSATLLDMGLPVLLVVFIALLVGAAVGAVNGMGVAFLGITPFVMTLAAMVAVRGLAYRVTDGAPQSFDNSGGILSTLGSGSLGFLPGPFVIFLVIAVLGWLLLRYTAFGRYVYGIGGSSEAARLSGVPIKRTLILAYVISGMCAGIAGIMTAARLSTGDPTAGNLVELDSIAATVIGGTSLMGGVGGVGGTIFGAMLLALVSNILNLIGVSPFDQYVAKGLVIVAAVLIGARTAKRRRVVPTSNSEDSGAGVSAGSGKQGMARLLRGRKDA